MGKQQQQGLTPGKAYLTLYNLAQFGLWASILVLTAQRVLPPLLQQQPGGKQAGAGGVEGVWPTVGPLVKLAVGACARVLVWSYSI
jgi:hypothetical protein